MIIEAFEYLSIRSGGIYVQCRATEAFAHTFDMIGKPARIVGQFGDTHHLVKKVVRPLDGPIKIGDPVALVLKAVHVDP